MDSVEFRGRDGNRLHADACGPAQGVPVLLLHGGGQTRQSWHNTLTILGQRGWRAYTMDLRGHGDSEWAADGDYSMAAYRDDIISVARSFAQLPALVGASLGGISSLLAISHSPTPVARALVMVDVGPRIEKAGSQRIQDFMAANAENGFATLEEVADAVAAYNPHRPRPRDTSGLKKNLRQREDGRWVWHWDPRLMAGTRANFAEADGTPGAQSHLDQAARDLKIPALLIRGRESDLLSPQGVAHFLALAPHARFVDVAGAGHMIAGDRNDAFNNAVVEFLATVS